MRHEANMPILKVELNLYFPSSRCAKILDRAHSCMTNRPRRRNRPYVGGRTTRCLTSPKLVIFFYFIASILCECNQRCRALNDGALIYALVYKWLRIVDQTARRFQLLHLPWRFPILA